MRLFGTEQESVKRDLYTFECVRCSHLEVRGVLVRIGLSRDLVFSIYHHRGQPADLIISFNTISRF